MSFLQETKDEDLSARERKPSHFLWNCFFRFRNVARYAIPVEQPWLIVIAIAIAGISLWALLNNWILALFWPSLLEETANLITYLLLLLPCGIALGMLYYWGAGGLMGLLVSMTGINLSVQSVRHLVLFAGVPVYMISIIAAFWLSFFGEIESFLRMSSGPDTSVVFKILEFGVALWLLACAVLSVLRLHGALRDQGGPSFPTFVVGVCAPVILLAGPTLVLRLPSFATQAIADNIEELVHENESAANPVAERHYAQLGRRLIPESDPSNYLRFAYLDRAQGIVFGAHRDRQLNFLDSLKQIAPPDSRVFHQIAAELGVRSGDFESACLSYASIVERDSLDHYHRRKLVYLLLDERSSAFNPEAAFSHALYLSRATGLRQDEALYGTCRYHMGDYKEAYAILHPLMMSDQRDSQVAYFLALTSMELKRYKMAIRLFDMSLNSEVRNQSFVLQYGRYVNELKDSIQVLARQKSISLENKAPGEQVIRFDED